MIRFNCPNCGTALKVPDDRAGQKVKCPKCGRHAAVPECLDDEPPAAELDESPGRRMPIWAWAAIAGGVLVLVVATALIAARVGRNSASDSEGPVGGGDLQKIQGRWKVVSVVIDGIHKEDRVPPERRQGAFISFEGTQLTTNKGDRAGVLLYPGQNPKQITLTWEDGDVHDGIYELAGDQLKICFAARSKRARPTSFEVGRQDRDVNLWVLRREK